MNQEHEIKELIKESTVSKTEMVQKEGNRRAIKTLKEYITKRFVLDDDMRKNSN